MFFWFKRKKLVLDCLTFNNQICELFPIAPATEHIPNWYKALPAMVPHKFRPPQGPIVETELPSMKYCSGFKDFYAKSFVLPSWSDYEFFVDEDGRITSSNVQNMGDYQSHNTLQWGRGFPGMCSVKLNSPWRMKGPKGIYWAWVEAQHHRPPDIQILSGMLEWYHQHESNVNILLPKAEKDTATYTIEAGEPLVHLIPMSEHNIEVRNHVVDMLEWEKIKPWHHSRFHSYLKTRAMVEKKEAEMPKRCPFGFGSGLRGSND